jgi:DNA mismatch endonuclease (patch repair protein)
VPDIVAPEVRSRMMSGIRGKDTKPELFVRSALHCLGFRFRLHDRHLPGRPDIVLKRYNAVVFIHGCFWHGHDCHLFKWPGSRSEFWRAKIFRNRQVDEIAVRRLADAGWRILTIWECALKGRTRLEPEKVPEAMRAWLLSHRRSHEIRGK